MMIYIMAEYRPAGPVYLKFVLIAIIHYFYIIFQMTVIIVAVSYRDIGRSGSADLSQCYGLCLLKTDPCCCSGAVAACYALLAMMVPVTIAFIMMLSLMMLSAVAINSRGRRLYAGVRSRRRRAGAHL